MKLKENHGVTLIFLDESFKKQRRKPREKQRKKNVWVKPLVEK